MPGASTTIHLQSGSSSVIQYGVVDTIFTKTVTLDYNGPRPTPLVSHPYKQERRTLQIAGNVDITLPGRKGSSAKDYHILGNPMSLCSLRASGTSFTPSPNLGLNAWNKALASMQGANVNLATFFGEGHETLSMFATTARRIASAALAIKKGNFGHAFKSLGVEPGAGLGRRLQKIASNASNGSQLLGNAWLEFSYGWKPLISDLYGSVAAYHAGFCQTGHKFKIHGSESQRDDKPVAFPAELGLQVDPVYKQPWVGHAFRDIKGKAGATVHVTNSVVSTLQQLGLMNPASLAWELLPFSFVVDWFVPVGNFLAASTANLGVTIENGWSSSETTYGLDMRVYNGSYTDRSVFYARDVQLAIPSVAPLGRLIDGLDGHGERQASAISLLQQAFFRR
ncbi:maturation protein [ssRNA phage Gerhypos.1_35]|uniref:Maturation protein n=2 Tax=Fiersviridae TaxID=2842319 RepID=A0A8S5KYG6_9VIRU|nr:maturation protein [ssRNA phage Gerhypos.1_35]DAD50093.1 TPA_asm: maturation protein [ssRNA phage Gerhypos.1_35]